MFADSLPRPPPHNQSKPWVRGGLIRWQMLGVRGSATLYG